MSDEELERLKRRRLKELQKRLLIEREKEEEDIKEEVAPEPSNQEILDKFFVGRSWEVYNSAKAQFPQIVPQIENVLVEAIKTGRVKNKINGVDLYNFFRRVGLPVRLKTKIRYSEKGKLKTLEEKIRGDIG
ncbi:MAG: DNA-binding protein [Candidatus Bathyarchaeia archaeon]